jgi:hypothetical protein
MEQKEFSMNRKEETSIGEDKQYIARKINWDNMGKKVVLVNICDEELLGTTVKAEQVDMPISRDYFGVDKVSEIEAINLVKSSSIVNLAGSRIVTKVVRANLANEKAVKRFGDVSFLMIYKF